MGNPLKVSTARTLRRKVLDYKPRVDRVFGEYDPGEDTYEGAVQRAIEALLDATEALIGAYSSKSETPAQ